jgi:uncharacterized membrane protein YtjA (UPF0391 family)
VDTNCLFATNRSDLTPEYHQSVANTKQFEKARLEQVDCLGVVYMTNHITEEPNMLGLVVTLLIIALIAGILGFGGIAGAAVGFAKIVFLVSLILILVSLVFGGLRGGFGRSL